MRPNLQLAAVLIATHMHHVELLVGVINEYNVAIQT